MDRYALQKSTKENPRWRYVPNTSFARKNDAIIFWVKFIEHMDDSEGFWAMESFNLTAYRIVDTFKGTQAKWTK